MLSRHLCQEILQGATTINIKAIAIAEGMIPSEVTQCTYEIKPNLKPVDMRNARDNIIRADLFNKGKDADEYEVEKGVHSTPG